MGGRVDDLFKNWNAHQFFGHQVDVFTATVVVDVIESVGVGETGFVHTHIFCLVVHVADEFDVVKTNAFKVLGKVDASNFYLNASGSTLYHGFVAHLIKVKHCS